MNSKYLTESEIAELLKISPVTIQRWEHQGKIPFKIIKNQKCYKKSEILEWAVSHGFVISKESLQVKSKSQHLISRAIEAGGIYYDIPGENVLQVLEAAVQKLNFIPKSKQQKLFNELLDREEMASTGIGKGIAIPHTRHRQDFGLKEPHIALFYLQNPIDFNSVDGHPVTTMFMIFSLDTKLHLKILSRFGRLIRKRTFLDLIVEKGDKNIIIEGIKKLENEI